MKLKTLSILTAIALALTLPLVAQAQDSTQSAPDQTQQMQDQTAVDQSNLTADQQEDQSGVDADLNADVQDDQASVEAGISAQDMDQDSQAAVDEDSTDESRELPQTASPLALIALLGTASVGTAAGLRALRS